MSITKEAYDILQKFRGEHEIAGPQDNPLIELMHRLTNIEGDKGGPNTDEIPWCSSFVNLGIVLACIKRNPHRAAKMLAAKKHSPTTIAKCFKLVGLEYTGVDVLEDTGKEIIEPTWSAWSLSWDQWGKGVALKDLQVGDIVRLTRNGGGHVAFFEGKGLVSLTLFGGNQGDAVNSSNRYIKSRFVTGRRA